MLLEPINFWEVNDVVDFLSTFIGNDEERVYTTLKVLDNYKADAEESGYIEEAKTLDKVMQIMNLKKQEREMTLRKLKFVCDFEAITGRYELIEKILRKCDGVFSLSYDENKDLFCIQEFSL